MAKGRPSTYVKVITWRDIEALKFIYLNDKCTFETLKKHNIHISEERLGKLVKSKYLKYVEKDNTLILMTTNSGFKETGLVSKKQINYLKYVCLKRLNINWSYSGESQDEINKMLGGIRTKVPTL
jgi:hypothetical protein